jgi:methylenetetrahydrofolate dehydrogenase (NADP+) / methenyltetrahydrofolate cyclohydrolase
LALYPVLCRAPTRLQKINSPHLLMILLNGQKLADRILGNLKKEIKCRRLKLKLAVVLVGNDPASKIYVRKKGQAAKKIGIDFKLYHFSGKLPQAELEKEIKKIVLDDRNTGVMVQLPLPKNKDTAAILDLIPENKDVDFLSAESFKNFSQGKIKNLPPTVGAISLLLEEYKIDTKGKYVVVVGAGRLVGKPVAIWLESKKVKFAVLDKKTEDILPFVKKADILITGVGKPNLINGAMIKDGIAVIDVGISKKNGKTVGDIDFKSVVKKAGYVTPILGGVGPLTVACLLGNLIKLQK